MLKHTTIVLCGALMIFPAAVQPETLGEKIQRHMTGKNVGRIVGAGVGALLGSQIGEGKGQLAAVAIGTLAGFWLGGEIGDRLAPSDQRGIARTTETALHTGQNQSWTNPDTGVTANVNVRDTQVTAPVASMRAMPGATPPLEHINEFYQANSTSNVRAGPGTEHAVIGTIIAGEQIVVVGRVLDDNWYMVSDDGLGSGFVYAPLLEPTGVQTGTESALRTVSGHRPSAAPQMQLAEDRRCSLITQEVILPDGTRQSHDMKACQGVDGAWEVVG